MPTEQIIALLIAERDKLNRAIEALGAPTRRRGRPPRNAGATAGIAAPSAVAPKRRRRQQSASQKKAQSERMKAYWAARRKKQAKE